MPIFYFLIEGLTSRAQQNQQNNAMLRLRHVKQFVAAPNTHENNNILSIVHCATLDEFQKQQQQFDVKQYFTILETAKLGQCL